MSSSTSALFRPLPVGAINVGHRVVMAPLTRFRANKDHVHGELAETYYTQRASVPGTLLVTEATPIAPQAGGVRECARYLERRPDRRMETGSYLSIPCIVFVVNRLSLQNRSPTPSTPRDLSFSSSYELWAVLRALASSRRKGASTSSVQVPFDITLSRVAAMNRSSPENLRAQSSKSTSNYTPRRQRTRSKPVSMASRYMGPMATFWTNSYSLYPTTGRTSTEDRSKIVCASRSKSLTPLWRPWAPNGRGCVSARGPPSKVRRNIARAS